ncbi:Leucine aminopeptidase 1 [Rhizopus azygosporus]|uniref:Peptide hydrolase n=1 Tax=Rhizopus azygosporus TaxID=86630 RepID=A0A367KEF6_RHIAZ|nr:Leucine aminopeptidase 1 [Rhizopus azygosporus]
MKLISLSFLSLSALAALVNASPLIDQIRIFDVPEPQRRLIQYSDDVPPKWMTESDKSALLRAGIKFMDITDHPNTPVTSFAAEIPAIPTKAIYQQEAEPFIGNLTTDTMETVLTHFTSFRNRYYKSKYGAESCRWLIQQIRDIASGNDHVSVKEFKHSWDQFSIIARFEGSSKDLENEVVIVGAHQDSVNMWLPSFGRSPGADDDGSGTVTILEAFRSLVHNGFKPERPVEFHWYSGEEAGLLGSQDVADKYYQDGKRVVAMLQNDMTGFIGKNKDKEVIGIVTDHVDEKLTDFLKALVDTYAAIPYSLTECGYACSDHASWRKLGFPSAFTIESEFDNSNPYIHTTRDVIENLSFDHMKEFAKVAVGFAVELSHVRD